MVGDENSELDKKKRDIWNKAKNFFLEKEPVSASPAQAADDELEKRTKEIWNYLVQKKIIYYLGLIPIFIIALYVRTRNLPYLAGKYLIELDSYFFFRYAKTILETGTLPVIDYMRYSPIGQATAVFKFFPQTMVYWYKFIHFFFPNLSQIEWHIYYPPVIAIIGFVFFFLFVKELFGHRIALISTAFLAVVPAYIQRTSAGFADHEAMAMLWMFVSLWLFALMWKSDKCWKSATFGVASGIFAGMMASTWGGHAFLKLSIALFFLAAALFECVNINKLVGYACWWFVYQGISNIHFGQKFINLPSLRTYDVLLIALGILVFLTGRLLVPRAQEKVRNFRNVPSYFAALVLLAIVLGVPALLTKLVDISSILSTFQGEASSRFGTTVSESQQPFFFGGAGWWMNFDWLLMLAMLGATVAIFLIYKDKSENRLLRNKYAVLAVFIFAAFLISFIFGRFSPGALLVNFFTKTDIYWTAICFLTLLTIYVWSYRENPEKYKKIFAEENWALLLPLAWLIVTLLMAHGQIRLLFAVSAPIAICAGFFSGKSLEWLHNTKAKYWKVLFALIAIFSICAFYSAYQQSLAFNRGEGPMIPGQWEAAMTFIRMQTPKDSVFAHWWDYGHMTSAIGERAAVTDGGNLKSWNHASGRYFLTGKDEVETLKYFKSHNVTHFLISEEEIPKYHAFSLIGSDENLDRYSTIGVFSQQQQKEVRNGTMLFYGGGWALDKDIVLPNGQVLPAWGAGIGGFSLLMASDGSVSEPSAYVGHKGQNYKFDIACLYAYGKRLDFETDPANTLKGCLIFIPYFKDQNSQEPMGAALWVSEKVWDTNMARLYLYGEKNPRFEQVYSDNVPLGIYQGRLIGPIKIWKINYPPGIKADPKYLEPSIYG